MNYIAISRYLQLANIMYIISQYRWLHPRENVLWFWVLIYALETPSYIRIEIVNTMMRFDSRFEVFGSRVRWKWISRINHTPNPIYLHIKSLYRFPEYVICTHYIMNSHAIVNHSHYLLLEEDLIAHINVSWYVDQIFVYQYDDMSVVNIYSQ
jgi:hypothetical protein